MEYIKPGDIYRFGSICEVVQFIRSLKRENITYKTYYNSKLDFFEIYIREV